MAQAGMVFTLCLLFVLGYVLFVRWIIKNEYLQDSYLGGPTAVALIIGGILTIVCVIVGSVALFDMLQIWLAPKIYVMEYASSLIKGK